MVDHIICFASSEGIIDSDTGIIRGVSIITEGVALGHGVIVDAKTLQQVQQAASEYAGGLKVKLNHSGQVGDIVGYLDTLRISGKKLLGDLHLLDSSPHRQYILEIARKIPETFGLSIAFSGPSELAADKKTMLQRCSEIFSVDVVDSPAANPDGFFSRKLNFKQADVQNDIITPTMNDEMKAQIAAMIQDALTQYNDRLSKLEVVPSKPTPVDPPSPENVVNKKPMAYSAENEIVMLAAKEAAMAVLKEFSKNIGAPVAKVASAEAVKPVSESLKTFAQIVADKTIELKNKSEAISFCVKNNPAEYSAYRAAVYAGEIIKL